MRPARAESAPSVARNDGEARRLDMRLVQIGEGGRRGCRARSAGFWSLLAGCAYTCSVRACAERRRDATAGRGAGRPERPHTR